MVKLAKELRVLDHEGGRRNSATRAAIGQLLCEARASLEHGDWLTFVAERTPYTLRSAGRYMTLYRFTEEQPVRFHDLQHLGASKLYLIASLDNEAQRELLKRKTHVVPGHRRRLRFEEMTYQELLRLVFARALEPDPGAEAAKTFGRRIKALDKATNTLLDHVDSVDRGAAKAWCEALHSAADRLTEAFELEP